MGVSILLSCFSAIVITAFGGILFVVNSCRDPDMIEEEALLMMEM